MDSGTAFTIAVITSYDPLAFAFQEFDLGPDTGPDDVFDDEHAPQVREYPFDLNGADDILGDAGYERTTGWRWAGRGRGWGAVVQQETGYYGSDAALAQRETRPWEQGGYEG